MIDRKTRELTQEDVSKIANVYHEWRTKDGDYIDIAGFVKSETLEEIEKNNYVLTLPMARPWIAGGVTLA